MRFDEYSYRIAGHFASALINGDETGLDDKESAQLTAFLDALPAGAGHWSGFDEDSANFTRCEVCGMFAETYAAVYMVPEVAP